VCQIATPATVHALSTFTHVDYEDTFLVKTSPTDSRSGEQLARVVFENAPAIIRVVLPRGWFVLGLRLDRDHSEHAVLGWRLHRNTPDFALLAAGSRFGLPAELLFMREGHGFIFATFVKMENLFARAAWTAIAPLHRTVVRCLLTLASRRYEHCPRASHDSI
jgi:hypothetical protein